MPAKHKDRGIRLTRDGFHPPEGIPENIRGMKVKLCVFIPSDFLLFSPASLPFPRYNSISSPPSSSSCSSAPKGPWKLSLEAPPWPRWGSSLSCSSRGLFSSPGFPCGWSLHETPAGFHQVSLQQEIWFCFPQISVFTFSSNKNTKEINCFLIRSHRLDQMCALSAPFLFSPKRLNKIVR